MIKDITKYQGDWRVYRSILNISDLATLVALPQQPWRHYSDQSLTSPQVSLRLCYRAIFAEAHRYL